MVLALGWTFRCNIGGLHLRPVRLDAGKGHLRTFYAHRTLHSLNARQGVAELLDQAEAAARNGSGWSQPDYDVLHGQTGQPM